MAEPAVEVRVIPDFSRAPDDRSLQVLIIEDHPVVAKGTQDLIEVQFPELKTHLCRTAAEAEEAVADPQRQWHRIFLDLNIPGAVGLSTARTIAKAGLQARCCVVTGVQREDYVDQIHGMGFIGYILKNLPIDEFSDSLGRVINGERIFLTKTSTDQKRPRITRRQAAILVLAARGLSSKQIADKLCIATGTVDNQLSTAMMALDVGTRTAAVTRALELGIIDLNESS